MLDELPIKEDVKPVPGENGWPFFGHTLEILVSPVKWAQRMQASYGNIHRYRMLFRDIVMLRGPEALEFVWMDRDGHFSAEKGYHISFSRLAPHNLLMSDGADHRAQRKVMTAAFKTDAMRGYLDHLNDVVPARVEAWGKQGHLKFYPAVKALAFDLATSLFLGLRPGPQQKAFNRALTQLMAASVSIVRFPLPFTALRRGLKARRFLENYLKSEIAGRRQRAEAPDLFSRLCHARDEDGQQLSEEDIVGNMILLWVAGHETLTSSLTTLTLMLSRRPEWQEKLRAEAQAVLSDSRLDYDRLGELVLTDYAFREALRILPPALQTPREVVKDVVYQWFLIPKGMMVSASIGSAHLDPEIWPNPERFDPMRFAPGAEAKARHRFAWAPFGGGPHMCIGLHFAFMQAKCVMANLISRYELVVPDGYAPRIRMLPLPKPLDELPITLQAATVPAHSDDRNFARNSGAHANLKEAS